jgi:hypothetical protein
MQDTVAVALIAVGGTVSSAVLSYLGTRHTTSIQLSASSESTEAQLRSVYLEIRKLEESQAAELRQSRQRLYQDYLAAAYALRDLIAGASLDTEDDALPRGRKALRDREIEIELLASSKVKAHTSLLFDLLIGFIEQADDESTESFDSEEFRGLLVGAFQQTKWRATRDALIEAMSEELAPTSPVNSFHTQP